MEGKPPPAKKICTKVNRTQPTVVPNVPIKVEHDDVLHPNFTGLNYIKDVAIISPSGTSNTSKKNIQNLIKQINQVRNKPVSDSPPTTNKSLVSSEEKHTPSVSRSPYPLPIKTSGFFSNLSQSSPSGYISPVTSAISNQASMPFQKEKPSTPQTTFKPFLVSLSKSVDQSLELLPGSQVPIAVTINITQVPESKNVKKTSVVELDSLSPVSTEADTVESKESALTHSFGVYDKLPSKEVKEVNSVPASPTSSVSSEKQSSAFEDFHSVEESQEAMSVSNSETCNDVAEHSSMDDETNSMELSGDPTPYVEEHSSAECEEVEKIRVLEKSVVSLSQERIAGSSSENASNITEEHRNKHSVAASKIATKESIATAKSKVLPPKNTTVKPIHSKTNATTLKPITTLTSPAASSTLAPKTKYCVIPRKHYTVIEPVSENMLSTKPSEPSSRSKPSDILSNANESVDSEGPSKKANSEEPCDTVDNAECESVNGSKSDETVNSEKLHQIVSSDKPSEIVNEKTSEMVTSENTTGTFKSRTPFTRTKVSADPTVMPSNQLSRHALENLKNLMTPNTQCSVIKDGESTVIVIQPVQSTVTASAQNSVSLQKNLANNIATPTRNLNQIGNAVTPMSNQSCIGNIVAPVITPNVIGHIVTPNKNGIGNIVSPVLNPNMMGHFFTANTNNVIGHTVTPTTNPSGTSNNFSPISTRSSNVSTPTSAFPKDNLMAARNLMNSPQSDGDSPDPFPTESFPHSHEERRKAFRDKFQKTAEEEFDAEEGYHPLVARSFYYNRLVRDLDFVQKPNSKWQITIVSDNILCTKWNDSFEPERKIVIDRRMFVKVSVNQKVVLDIRGHGKIKTVEHLSTLLKETDCYVPGTPTINVYYAITHPILHKEKRAKGEEWTEADLERDTSAIELDRKRFSKNPSKQIVDAGVVDEALERLYNADAERPPFTEQQLIVQAFHHATIKRLSVNDVVESISKHHTYYKMTEDRWKKGIKLRLVSSELFLTIPPPPKRDGVETRCHHLYMLNPEKEANLVQWAFEPHYRNKRRRPGRPIDPNRVPNKRVKKKKSKKSAEEDVNDALRDVDSMEVENVQDPQEVEQATSQLNLIAHDGEEDGEVVMWDTANMVAFVQKEGYQVVEVVVEQSESPE